MIDKGEGSLRVNEGQKGMSVVSLICFKEGADTVMELDLSGFYTGEGSVSERGFHIHTSGTIGAGGCVDTGGHYNPDNVNHGDRTAT